MVEQVLCRSQQAVQLSPPADRVLELVARTGELDLLRGKGGQQTRRRSKDKNSLDKAVKGGQKQQSAVNPPQGSTTPWGSGRQTPVRGAAHPT